MKTLATASVLLLAAVSFASPSLAQTPSSRSRSYDADASVPPPTSTRELGTVISVTPIVAQTPVPRQVCHDEVVTTQRQPSGGGALMGAIIGGALGNGVGAGVGRAAATAFGALGGAAIGNSIEADGQASQAQTVRRCTSETTYEDRAESYSVVYEYGGRQYTTVMRRDPGQYVQVQVQAVGAGEAAPQYAPPPRTRSSPPVSSRQAPVYVDRGDAPRYADRSDAPRYADRGDAPRYADRGDYPRYAEPVYRSYPPPAPAYYYDYGPPPAPNAAQFGTGLVVGALIGYGLSRDYRGHGRYWRR